MTATRPVGERPTWVDDELFPFESHFAEIDGNVVHYVDEGSGPTLLMLTGNPVWSFVYREAILTLRDRFRCIAVDFPGFGLSTGAAGNRFLAQDHADVLVSFVDQLDLTGVTLIGHNWGGPLGLHAAQRRPARFERLILANTWAWPLNGDPLSEASSRGLGNWFGRELIKRTNLFVRFYIPMSHKRRTPSDAEMAHYLAASSTPESRTACAALPGQLVGAKEFFVDLESRIGELQDLPVLILWADSDPIFTDKYRRGLEERFPAHTTTVFRDVGHFLQSDAPVEFSDAIAIWMADQT